MKDKRTIDEILLIADQIIPEWRRLNRTQEAVFARILLATELKHYGLTVRHIGNIFNKHYASIIHLLKKDVSYAYLTPKERQTFSAWQAAINADENAGSIINKLCKEIRRILCLTCGENVTIYKNSYIIGNDRDKEEPINTNSRDMDQTYKRR